MVLSSLSGQVAMAVFGGCVAELLHWYALSRRPGVVPKYRKRLLYWATTAAMIVVGGAMPLLYLQGEATALLCFHLGAATPVIVQKLIAALPSMVVAQGPGDTTLRDFFRW